LHATATVTPRIPLHQGPIFRLRGTQIAVAQGCVIGKGAQEL